MVKRVVSRFGVGTRSVLGLYKVNLDIGGFDWSLCFSQLQTDLTQHRPCEPR